MQSVHSALVAVLVVVVVVMVAAPAAAAAATAAAAPSSSVGKADASYRLPGHVVPSHYTVHIGLPQGSSAMSYFEGAISIEAYVVRATNEIVMHSTGGLVIHSISVTRENGVEVPIEVIRPYSNTQFLVITLEERLEVKEAIDIRMTYTMTFPDRMEGFYKSYYKYTTSEGREHERVVFATQFAPTYARGVFPAFDDPGYKATFQLSVDTPPGFNALSNTPVLERTIRNENGRKTDTVIFMETPRMSIHLLAFLVYEEFTYANTSTVASSVPLTSWATKDDVDARQTDFSQSETPKILRVMEDYTGIPFAQGNLQKIDEVALPDFTASAMENWGLIVYREDTLLVDPEQGTAHDRQHATETIARQIAHQWFGNLVTPEWWDYAWLSEGFARYFQYWIPGQLNPDWRMEEQLLVDIQQSIFETDALPSARPLTTEAYSPAEIVERFGEMSYDKGSAVVRMIKNIMGAENFQNALRSYLEKNALGSVSPRHLLAELDAHTPSDATPGPLNLSAVIYPWTILAGFPVLTVDVLTHNTLLITQDRFFASGTGPYTEAYFVPFQIHLQGGASTPRLWSGPGLPKRYEELLDLTTYVEVASTEQWVVVNSTGYFRVNYWPENWERLGAALREGPGAVAPAERAQLVDDALNLARAALLPYSTALDLARYLARETDYVPWKAAFRGLDFLGRLLANVDEEGVFQAFLLELLEGVYAHLGFVDEGSHLDKLLRTQVLERACAAGHADCLQAAHERLTDFLQKGRDIEPDLRSVVYCYGVKAEGNSVWEALLGRLQLIDNSGERRLLIASLGCSSDVKNLNNYLKQSLNPNVVRQQDAAAVFTAVYTNPLGVDPALDFLVNRFDDIKRAYGGMHDINNIVRGIAKHLSTDSQQIKIYNLIWREQEILGESGEIARSTVDANVQWLSKRKQEVLNAMRRTYLT